MADTLSVSLDMEKRVIVRASDFNAKKKGKPNCGRLQLGKMALNLAITNTQNVVIPEAAFGFFEGESRLR
jgi:hypothetical protein